MSAAEGQKPVMRIDFVSDVACPWCGIGLISLERALEKIGDDLEKDREQVAVARMLRKRGLARRRRRKARR